MANKEFRVIVSKQAAQMLTEHAAFLARVSAPAARRLVRSFQAATESLQVMPRRCPWFVGEFIPANTYRYFIIETRYLLIFQIQENTVFVDYVLDCRQDYSWLLR